MCAGGAHSCVLAINGAPDRGDSGILIWLPPGGSGKQGGGGGIVIMDGRHFAARKQGGEVRG
jgi:hypothetical protein